MATEFNPELEDDVPTLKKYDVNITLETLLSALVERPRGMLQVEAGQAARADLHPEIAQHLQRISDLASELRQEIMLINQIDPDALARLKQA
jgi:hypothetical protein